MAEWTLAPTEQRAAVTETPAAMDVPPVAGAAKSDAMPAATPTTVIWAVRAGRAEGAGRRKTGEAFTLVMGGGAPVPWSVVVWA